MTGNVDDDLAIDVYNRVNVRYLAWDVVISYCIDWWANMSRTAHELFTSTDSDFSTIKC